MTTVNLQGLTRSEALAAFYLKSEADKVIEELELKLARAQLVLRLNEPQALYSNLETMSRLNHEKYVIARRERHHKYKRCLAMARWCEAEAQKCLTQQGAMIGFPWTDRFQYLQWQITHYSRWHRIWLELAEKFKDAKL